jgi:hypothetical protein
MVNPKVGGSVQGMRAIVIAGYLLLYSHYSQETFELATNGVLLKRELNPSERGLPCHRVLHLGHSCSVPLVGV